MKNAIVLAHGMGEHCFPFGGEKAVRPKYAMEVGNIPLIRRVLENLFQLGISRIYVVPGFQAQALKELLVPFQNKITLVEINDYQHGDAIALAECLKQIQLNEPALIVNADLMTFETDYRKMISAFQESHSRSCVLYDELHPEEDRLSWFGVEVENDQMVHFQGHVPETRNRVSGLYIFTADDLVTLQKPQIRNQKAYLAEQLPRLQSPLIAVKSEGPLVHVDRTFDYLEANQVCIQQAVVGIHREEGVYVYESGKDAPNPDFIFPGTIIEPGVRIVFEEGSFIGPFQTLEAHREAAPKMKSAGIIPIRIRGNLHLGEGSRIGLNAIIEGNLVVGRKSSIEDAVIEPNVLLGNEVVVRRHATIRGLSVCADQTRFECAADFEGVAGKGTIYMHPGQCWIVTGQRCDLGAGNFFGTWRFDSKRCSYLIGGRSVMPKSESISNASYIGDDVRTAIGVFFLPGTRVGADALIGAGYIASGTMEGGYSYYWKPENKRIRVGLVRSHGKK